VEVNEKGMVKTPTANLSHLHILCLNHAAKHFVM